MDCKAGDTLCGCNLVQKCGEGAYGEVWLAVDPIGTRLAVKIIPNRGRYGERELAGLRNYKDCNHPNLLKIRHIEFLDEAVCYTMDAADNLNRGDADYLPDTLANRLRQYKRLDGQEVAVMLDGLLAGLEELHKHKLVHRDIKPDNILWVNGRPTLADASLIAPEGKGSLVGTPGFLSPKLLSKNGRADASDDFYALGKVIYCALTGNPVEEFPSIPRDVTISVDAALGRACRESCKHPIHSSAEFRTLLREKPKRRRFPWKIITGAVGVVGLAVVLNFLWFGRPYQREKTETLPETPPEIAALEARPKQMQREIIAELKRLGFWREDRLQALLDYRPMATTDCIERIMRSNEHPRLNSVDVPRVTPKTTTALENRLIAFFMLTVPEFDLPQVRERQAYWRGQPGTPLEIQRRMLESDPVMQAVTFDAVIRAGVNAVLQSGTLSETDKRDLLNLRKLRLEALSPGLVAPADGQDF